MNHTSVSNVNACNNVNNTNTIATSCIENVSAQFETSVDTNQYNELSLPKYSDISKQAAVHFIRELDEYFTLRKTPEELRLPLLFRSISDQFAKQWMLTTYGQLKSYNDFKKAFTELLWDGTRQSEIRCRVYQDRYNYRSGESLSEHYIRYSNMPSMLSPAMSDQDLLGAMITHYEPRIQNGLISANLKSTQETLAFLTKLQSLENSREQYRSARRDFERQEQIAEYRETSLFTTRRIADLMAVFRYSMSGVMAGTGNLGLTHSSYGPLLVAPGITCSLASLV